MAYFKVELERGRRLIANVLIVKEVTILTVNYRSFEISLKIKLIIRKQKF